MKTTTTLGLLLLLVVPACGPLVSDSSEEAELSLTTDKPGVIYTLEIPEALKGDHPDKRKARARMMDAAMEVYEEVRMTLKAERPFGEKSRAIRELLASRPEEAEERWLLEQMVALHLLEAYDAQYMETADVAEVGFYTRLLVKHESPNADLILKGLHAVRNSWTEAEIAAAARTAVAQAKAWLEKACPGCRLGLDPATEARVQDAQSAHVEAVRRAASELSSWIDP